MYTLSSACHLLAVYTAYWHVWRGPVTKYSFWWAIVCTGLMPLLCTVKKFPQKCVEFFFFFSLFLLTPFNRSINQSEVFIFIDQKNDYYWQCGRGSTTCGVKRFPEGTVSQDLWPSFFRHSTPSGPADKVTLRRFLWHHRISAVFLKALVAFKGRGSTKIVWGALLYWNYKSQLLKSVIQPWLFYSAVSMKLQSQKFELSIKIFRKDFKRSIRAPDERKKLWGKNLMTLSFKGYLAGNWYLWRHFFNTILILITH